MNLALVTYEGLPDLGLNDRLLLQTLRNRNINVSCVVWNNPSVVWSDFDCVVIRSTWDYFHALEEYKEWILSFNFLDVQLINPAEMIFNNLNKRYLIELQNKGLNVVPSLLVKKNNYDNFRYTVNKSLWNDLVAKPVAGASGFRVVKFKKEMFGQLRDKFEVMLKEGDVLIQPFINDINDNGEWSFIFFNHQYSHAVLKRPRNGDFRVQGGFGGEYIHADPSKDLVDQAKAFINTINGQAVYARVDAIEINGELMLMELELNEPCLFFEKNSSQVMNRFVDVITGCYV